MKPPTKVTDEEIMERLEKLPRTLRISMQSVDTKEVLLGIAKEEQLHIDQADTLLGEGFLVLLGLTPRDQFPSKLAEVLSVDRDRARTVAKKINERLFLPIRESFKEATTETMEETSEPPKEAPPTKEEGARQPNETIVEAPQQIPNKQVSQNPLEEKLSGVVRAQSVEVKNPPSITSEKNIRGSQRKDGYTVDPYREPVEGTGVTGQ